MKAIIKFAIAAAVVTAISGCAVAVPAAAVGAGVKLFTGEAPQQHRKA